MRFTAALLLTGASAAAAFTLAAASAPTDTGICAQSIVDACIPQFDKQVKACAGDDYICMCENYTNKLTCYNNCMGSEERPPVQNQVTQFCLAAEPQRSASSASLASFYKTAGTPSAAPTTASSPATESSEATTTDSSEATVPAATPSGFNSSKNEEGAAAALDISVGGVMAAVLVLARWL